MLDYNFLNISHIYNWRMIFCLWNQYPLRYMRYSWIIWLSRHIIVLPLPFFQRKKQNNTKQTDKQTTKTQTNKKIQQQKKKHKKQKNQTNKQKQEKQKKKTDKKIVSNVNMPVGRRRILINIFFQGNFWLVIIYTYKINLKGNNGYWLLIIGLY